ncbi:hypothetical protein WJX73_003728 [Symbiochloris irregularis]|uniref:Aminotransferase class V domain-containing protein n=1 Tax=Symbiochloris irregularis TaxID=706552 RepID=A0AAW1NZU2_9CHLO
MDLDQVRRDTPGVADVIHFNNAGMALPTQAVVDIQKDWLDREATLGGYEVFYGIPFQQGDRILTTMLEYGANYIAFLQVAKRTGAVIEVIAEDANGDIDIPALEQMVTSGPKKPALIALVHVPSNCGRVYDAAAVGRVARAHSIPYLLDACQSVGQMPVDVAAIGCDWATGTSRKFLRGPRGIGWLYASRSSQHTSIEPAQLDNSAATWTTRDTYEMSSTAKRYEVYEKNFAAMVPGVSLFDQQGTLCGIVAFAKAGTTADDAQQQLQQQGINTWVTPLTTTRLAFEAKGITEDQLRLSVHYYNTEEEVQRVVAAVAALKPSTAAKAGLSSAFWLLMGGAWSSRRASSQ